MNSICLLLYKYEYEYEIKFMNIMYRFEILSRYSWFTLSRIEYLLIL